MREQCDPHMRIACAHGCDAECHVTERDGTERKSIQDPALNSLVPNAVGAVDNPKFVRFLELDNAGWSARLIAQDLGINPRTVSRWRVLSGRVKRVPRGPLPLSDHERVRELVEEGASLREAAHTVGVSEWTARMWWPDLPRWSRSDAGRQSGLVRRLNQMQGRAA